MSGGKKYNAFSGVFTPSLLTILGVIMYLRLSWVVGEAGLIGTLIIIAIAHIISVTTGLSISSIATDKKIKTGGIYYILSRSLGMPMGGAIGIALFIGTALSISLYIVGFAESFLSVQAIQDFTGLAPDINGFRIVGSVVMILLVVVAFISTSLAMKIQFFILISIALSLVSIALGFFQNAGDVAVTIPMSANGEFPLEYVFAIFFPAVTGFTAGVAMSGDLTDPKKAIPRGTILAIGVGFLVYVLLSVGIAMFIPRETLISDYNILVEVAWSSALVIAGIWGATLSSALGGILGGPRILQAMAKDKMSPKIFSKGYGESNEPRNALLLIFAIAEGGILIGELDIIAGVVSMFYLASYGFINLSYVLEKWASTDFRPSFKIHIAFGIVGFIASFAVMFKLDMVSMFASLLIMGLLYFFLKRREIQSESGDVWQSVWASIIRRSLAKMEDKKIEERNWKPNILLFSGGSNKRPHLISFGKSIIGKYGLLSNFDLIESPDNKMLFSKNQQIVKEDSSEKGVFTRRQSVKNVYDGIEMIAQTYGFSGVEPNTVLMGWGRQTQNPKRFVQMLNTLSDLDLNVLLIDYDKVNGFGKKKRIDIWWRDAGKHGNLSLTVTKFLSNSLDWSNAKLRIMMVNSENNKADLIRRKAESFLENMRIDAELKIINNEIENKPFYDIMKAESQNTDLVFLGIPDIDVNNAEEFVQSTSDLMHKIGSVVLVKASSVFKHLHLGLSETELSKASSKIDVEGKETPLKPMIMMPTNPIVAEPFRKYTQTQEDAIKEHLKSSYQSLAEAYLKQIENSKQQISKVMANVRQRCLDATRTEQVIIIQNQKTFFLQKLNKQIETYVSTLLPEASELVETQYQNVSERQVEAFNNLPKVLKIIYNKSQMEYQKGDISAQRRYKWWRKRFAGQNIAYRLQFKKLIEEQYYEHLDALWLKHFESFGLAHIEFVIELLKLAKEVDNSFIVLGDIADKSGVQEKDIAEAEKKISLLFDNITSLNSNILKRLDASLDMMLSTEMNKLTSLLNSVHPNAFLEELPTEKSGQKKLKQKLQSVPKAWLRNQNLILNAVMAELKLLTLKTRVKTIMGTLNNDCQKLLEEQVFLVYSEGFDKKLLEAEIEDLDTSKVRFDLTRLVENTNMHLNKSIVSFPDTIEVYEDDVLNRFNTEQFNNMPSLRVSSKQLADFLIKNKLEAPLLNLTQRNVKRLSDLLNSINDSKRLISFAKESQDAESKLLISNSIKDIENQLSQIKSIEEAFSLELESLYTEISQQLTYYTFIKTASNLRQYISKQRTANKVGSVRVRFEKWSQTLKDWQVNFIYAKSQAVVLKKQYDKANQLENPVKKLLDFTESLTPSDEKMSALPFFYKQLFVGQQILHKDFWVGRDKELQTAQKAVARYHKGYKGAIAVVAENGLGKSFFIKQLMSLEQPKNRVNIDIGNATNSLESFKRCFNQATDFRGQSVEAILNRLEQGTWIVIDDFELWWQVGASEQKVIEYIFDLIAKYSNKFLFVLSSNRAVFDMLVKNKVYLEYFISIIQLGNVNAKTISEIILNRHQASGYKIKLNGKLYKDRNDSRFAGFFNKIHNSTQGNVEASLQMWINAIQKIEGETLHLEMPRISTSNLEVLDMDSRIVLKMILQYDRVRPLSLSKALDEDENTTQHKLAFLLRTGLVLSENNSYYLNPYCEFQVWNFLHHKQMI